MEQKYRLGTPVLVQLNERKYTAQVLFTHFGNPKRVLVAWLSSAPIGADPTMDWVDYSAIRPLEIDANPPGGGVMRPAL